MGATLLLSILMFELIYINLNAMESDSTIAVYKVVQSIWQAPDGENSEEFAANKKKRELELPQVKNNVHTYIKSLYPLSSIAIEDLQGLIDIQDWPLAKIILAYAEDIFCSNLGKLIHATLENDLAKLKSLIELGANIHQEDKYQRSVLWYALHLGRLQVIALLMAHGADIYRAIPNFALFMREKIFFSNKIEKMRELELFVKMCLEKEVQSYLEDKEAYCAKHIIRLLNDEKSCRFEFNQTLLMWAAIFHDIDTVKRILEVRPSKKYINAWDIDKNSAFHYAIRFGNEDIVKMLLEHIGDGFILKNRFGKTGLEIATANNDVLLFERLLKEEKRNMPALRRSLLIALKKNYGEIINRIMLKLITKGSILEQGKIVFPQTSLQIKSLKA